MKKISTIVLILQIVTQFAKCRNALAVKTISSCGCNLYYAKKRGNKYGIIRKRITDIIHIYNKADKSHLNIRR